MGGKTIPGNGAYHVTDDEEGEVLSPWWEAQTETLCEDSKWKHGFTNSVKRLLDDYLGQEDNTGRHAFVVAVMTVASAIAEQLDASLQGEDPYPNDFHSDFGDRLQKSLVQHLPSPQTPTRKPRSADTSADDDDDISIGGLPTPVSLPPGSPSQSRKAPRKSLPARSKSSKSQNVRMTGMQEGKDLSNANGVYETEPADQSDTSHSTSAIDGTLDRSSLKDTDTLESIIQPTDIDSDPTTQDNITTSRFIPINGGMAATAESNVNEAFVDIDAEKERNTESISNLQSEAAKTPVSGQNLVEGSGHDAARETRKRKAPVHSNEHDDQEEDDSNMSPSPTKRARPKRKQRQPDNHDTQEKDDHAEDEESTMIGSQSTQDYAVDIGIEINVDDPKDDLDPDANHVDTDTLPPTKSPYFGPSKDSKMESHAQHVQTSPADSLTSKQAMTRRLRSKQPLIADPDADKHIRSELVRLWEMEASSPSQATSQAYEFPLMALSASTLHSIVDQWSHSTQQVDIRYRSTTENSVDHSSLSVAMQLTAKALASISQAVGTGFQATILKWRGMLNLENAQQAYIKTINDMLNATERPLQDINAMINQDLAAMAPSNKQTLSVRSYSGIEDTVKKLFDAVFFEANFSRIITTKNRRRQGRAIRVLTDGLGEGALAFTLISGFSSTMNSLNLTTLDNILKIMNKETWVRNVMNDLKTLIDVAVQDGKQFEEQVICARRLKESIDEMHSPRSGVSEPFPTNWEPETTTEND